MPSKEDNGIEWNMSGGHDDFFPSDFGAQFAEEFNLNDGDSSAIHGVARSLVSFTSNESKLSRGAMSAPVMAGTTEDDYFRDKKKSSSKKISKKPSKKTPPKDPNLRNSPQDPSFGARGFDGFHQQQYPVHSAAWEHTPSDRNRGAPRNDHWDAFETENTVRSMHAPPFATIHVDHMADDVSRMPDPTEHLATFHGERLQCFLQQSGQDDSMAMQTALAFESFLKMQAQAAMAPTHIVESHFDDDEETRMEQMESLAIDDDTFVPDTSWENGSFVDPSAYNRKANELMANRDHQDKSPIRRQRAMPVGSQGRPGRPTQPPSIRPMSSLEERSIGSRESGNNSRGETSRDSRGENSRGNYSHNSRGIVSEHSRTSHGGRVSDHSRPSNGGRVSEHSRNSHPSNRSPPPVQQRQFLPRSFEDQLSTLPSPHRITVATLKRNWEQGGHGAFPNEWYLRFAKCSPVVPYDYNGAWKVMKKFDRRYLTLDIATMETFLRSRIIFPCQGLRNKFGHGMFYMQVNRFSPKEAPVDAAIDNLVYVMNCMNEDEQLSSRGIGFIMDMSDCKMHHFSVSYFHKILMALQGRKVPTRVEMFLIVNQPSWFSNMWGAVIKPMLHKDFREKTQRIVFNDLRKYLAPDFELFLPSEIYCGKANSDYIVRDFIQERKWVDANRRY